MEQPAFINSSSAKSWEAMESLRIGCPRVMAAAGWFFSWIGLNQRQREDFRWSRVRPAADAIRFEVEHRRAKIGFKGIGDPRVFIRSASCYSEAREFCFACQCLPKMGGKMTVLSTSG
jgi:hypothetical protein